MLTADNFMKCHTVEAKSSFTIEALLMMENLIMGPSKVMALPPIMMDSSISKEKLQMEDQSKVV